MGDNGCSKLGREWSAFDCRCSTLNWGCPTVVCGYSTMVCMYSTMTRGHSTIGNECSGFGNRCSTIDGREPRDVCRGPSSVPNSPAMVCGWSWRCGGKPLDSRLFSETCTRGSSHKTWDSRETRRWSWGTGTPSRGVGSLAFPYRSPRICGGCAAEGLPGRPMIEKIL